MPCTLAARISTPLPVYAFKVRLPKDSAPKPTLQQRMKAVSSIEETLGTNWLLKIGVTLFVMGMAYLGIQELRTLGAAGKALLSYLEARALRPGAPITVLARSESLDSITLDGPRGRATLGLRPAGLVRAIRGEVDASLFHEVPSR